MDSVLNLLDEHCITPTQFLQNLLTEDWAGHHASRDLTDHVGEVMSAFLKHNEATRHACLNWVDAASTNMLRDEMCLLTHKDSGFHFTANKTTDSKLVDFDIQQMSVKMQSLAPRLWNTLSILLEADPKLNYKRDWARRKAESLGKARKKAAVVPADGDIDVANLTVPMDIQNTEEDEHWAAFYREEINLRDDDEAEPLEGIVEDIEEQVSCLKTIVRIYIAVQVAEAHKY
jgi:hypothetical protein